jgi:hypothetical protein
MALSFKSAHPAGLCDVGYIDGGVGKPVQLVTCGKDGKLCYRSAADPGEVAKSIDAHTEGDGPSSLTAVAAAPLGDRVAVADEQNFVKVTASLAPAPRHPPSGRPPPRRPPPAAPPLA